LLRIFLTGKFSRNYIRAVTRIHSYVGSFQHTLANRPKGISTRPCIGTANRGEFEYRQVFLSILLATEKEEKAHIGCHILWPHKRSESGSNWSGRHTLD
jgi:hypothetical protein